MTVEGEQKRHTAAITPLVHAARILSIVLVIGVLQVTNMLGKLDAGKIVGVLAVSLLVVASVGGAAYLQWRRLEFWFDADGDLRVSSGILERKERRLHLSRLQSVEVVQPLIARVFGMAEVRVEVAGSGDSRITLSYLSLADANALRAETLARAAGVRPDAGEAPESVIVQVPSPVLLGSSLLSSGVLVTVLIIVGAVVVGVLAGGWVGLTGLIFVLIVPLFGVFGAFVTYFNFTLADSPDGLRIRFGLLGVKAHTVPPGRVASVEFVEPLLWRKFNWVSVRLTVAGAQSSDDDQQDSSSMLLPVATWPVAMAVVSRILPGVDVSTLPLIPVPPRVRRRSPLQWRQLGMCATDEVFAARHGWLTRRLSLTPHARVQSMRITQGPWERSLGLASVHADIVPGSIRPVGRHQPADVARTMAFDEMVRVRQARAQDTSTHWGHHPVTALPAETAEPSTSEAPSSSEAPAELAPPTSASVANVPPPPVPPTSPPVTQVPPPPVPPTSPPVTQVPPPATGPPDQVSS